MKGLASHQNGAPEPYASQDIEFACATGSRIYAEHRESLEQPDFGRFAAINLNDGSITVADLPLDALVRAKEQANGAEGFCVIRIGYTQMRASQERGI